MLQWASHHSWIAIGLKNLSSLHDTQISLLGESNILHCGDEGLNTYVQIA